MPDYYLYYLDGADHIRRRLEIECRDDAHAIKVVREHSPTRAMELWQSDRMVKRFEAVDL